jgi:hypothetical protein
MRLHRLAYGNLQPAFVGWPSGLLVVRPQAQHLHYALVFKHLIDEPVLNVDAPRIRASQIAHQFFVTWWGLKRIALDDAE